jgi:RNA polymerase sigma factor (sigma-70 family)
MANYNRHNSRYNTDALGWTKRQRLWAFSRVFFNWTIRQNKHLSTEDMASLADHKTAKAANILVLSILQLAIKRALSIARSNGLINDVDDLVQTGLAAACYAASTYKSIARFTTYVEKSIFWRMIAYLNNEARIIVLPSNLSRTDQSDALLPGEEFMRGIRMPELNTDNEDLRQLLYQMFFRDSKLSYRESEVLLYRFGILGFPQLTLTQVGALQGVTRERARQIEKRALKKLRYTKYMCKLQAYYD